MGDGLAAALGGVWVAGRIGYALGSAKDPALRGKGFAVGALAFGGLGLVAGEGVLWRLLGV